MYFVYFFVKAPVIVEVCRLQQCKYSIRRRIIEWGGVTTWEKLSGLFKDIQFFGTTREPSSTKIRHILDERQSRGGKKTDINPTPIWWPACPLYWIALSAKFQCWRAITPHIKDSLSFVSSSRRYVEEGKLLCYENWGRLVFLRSFTW